MKRFLAVAIFCVVGTFAKAQYVPNSNQAFQYMAIYNPAFSGIENFADLKMSYMYQWGNLPDAPKTINLTFNTRIQQPLDLIVNAPRTSNVAAFSKPEFIPRRKRIIQGLGGNVFNQSFGPTKINGAGVNYAFNYPISVKFRLAGGLSAIVQSIKIDNSIIFRDTGDPYVEYLRNNNVKQTSLNVRAGALLYSKNFYFGVSYLPVVLKSLQDAGRINDHPFYRMSVQTGVSFPLTAEITLKPSILMLVQMDNKINADFNLKAFIQNKLWLGVSYRDVGTGVMMLGMNINEKLGVSYSYEMSLNGFKQFNDGSHELVIGLRLNNLRKVNPYVW